MLMTSFLTNGLHCTVSSTEQFLFKICKDNSSNGGNARQGTESVLMKRKLYWWGWHVGQNYGIQGFGPGSYQAGGDGTWGHGTCVDGTDWEV